MLTKLIVFDNSEPSSNIDLTEFGDKIITIADGNNEGISKRLNQAAGIAIEHQSKWLLTMDQDSFFDEININNYLQCFDKYEKKDDVAVFGVEYEQKNESANCEPEETTSIITSGSFINLELYKKIGGFDEKLFIDMVDAEYSYRAIVNGYKTLKFKNVYLNHSLGTTFEHRSFKNFKKTSRTLHSHLRIYYMVRNFLYVKAMYHSKLPGDFSIMKASIVNRIKNNFFYSKNRRLLLKYLLLAYRHYKSGKMGKLKQV